MKIRIIIEDRADGGVTLSIDSDPPVAPDKWRYVSRPSARFAREALATLMRGTPSFDCAGTEHDDILAALTNHTQLHTEGTT